MALAVLIFSEGFGFDERQNWSIICPSSACRTSYIVLLCSLWRNEHWTFSQFYLRFILVYKVQRSVRFRMNLWGHRFSQNSNQKLPRSLLSTLRCQINESTRLTFLYFSPPCSFIWPYFFFIFHPTRLANFPLHSSLVYLALIFYEILFGPTCIIGTWE